MEKEAEEVLITDLLKAAMVCRVLAAILLQLSISGQFFIFIDPENVRKPLVSYRN